LRWPSFPVSSLFQPKPSPHLRQWKSNQESGQLHPKRQQPPPTDHPQEQGRCLGRRWLDYWCLLCDQETGNRYRLEQPAHRTAEDSFQTLRRSPRPEMEDVWWPSQVLGGEVNTNQSQRTAAT